ncbi:MAG: FkbM family methyltransferase [Bacteroidetes bacterium]|nr:FkbM family methyltransferase [Bacteroidota bacterium]
MDTLDNIIEPDHSNILLKIDVEGFEAAVLKGSNKLLSNPAVKAIIMELNGLGEQYGFDEKEMHYFLLQQGFNTYSYSPYERKLTQKNKLDINNTLYIRNEEFVKKRLSEAVVINIAGQQI